MTHPTSLAVTTRPPVLPLPASPWQQLLARQRTLALYGALLLALLLPMAIAAGLDERTLRGANVWLKPMKFALSIGLLAWTVAWFVGHLPAAQRRGRGVKLVVALVLGMGSFELAYITLQAALGQGSHYNTSGPLHATMYTLMGAGALLLTASQPLLAWLLWRHPQPHIAPAYRRAVLHGLVQSFVLGAGVGILLGGLQPPATGGLPLVGWAAHGDLRPAHFVGVHAAQVLPLVGLALGRRAQALRWVDAAAVLYALLCVGLVGMALAR